VIDAELGTMLVQSLAKQACERIDKVRLLAAKRFLRLVHSGAPALPQIDELRHLFPQGVEEDWTNYDNFAQFVGLVRFAEYRKAVLSGLVFSIGDVGQKAVSRDSEARVFLLFTSTLTIHFYFVVFDTGYENS
jgi:hypothetical protein